MVIKKVIPALLLFMAFISIELMAQQDNHQHSHEKYEKIKAARVAHITSRLNLSPEQAQKFWPVYNEFSDKRDALRYQHKKVIHAAQEQNVSNDEARNAINTHLRMEREEIALEEEYYGKKLQQVLDARQILLLMKAEHEFKKMLLDRLKEKPAN